LYEIVRLVGVACIPVLGCKVVVIGNIDVGVGKFIVFELCCSDKLVVIVAAWFGVIIWVVFFILLFPAFGVVLLFFDEGSVVLYGFHFYDADLALLVAH
jgi:hypothetical protein